VSREIFLLRHSKSDWDSHRSDHERPLNKRGQQNAKRIARWLKEKYLYPSLVLCSTAVRTRQTLAPIVETLELSHDRIKYLDELYLAELNTLLSILRNIESAESSVMLVGHNPGMEELVSALASTDVPLSNNGKLMPTTCLVHFKVPDDWGNLIRQAELVSVTRVKELDE
jgi:phosphohistidine phosphatase